MVEGGVEMAQRVLNEKQPEGEPLRQLARRLLAQGTLDPRDLGS